MFYCEVCRRAETSIIFTFISRDSEKPWSISHTRTLKSSRYLKVYTLVRAVVLHALYKGTHIMLLPCAHSFLYKD